MEAADGQQALNLLNQHQFKVVITDPALPKVTGFGLIGEIRRKWPNIPIILVTTYLSPAVAKELLTEKTKFISKPVDNNEHSPLLKTSPRSARCREQMDGKPCGTQMQRTKNNSLRAVR
jgi:CheY-like chemotaxis protein